MNPNFISLESLEIAQPCRADWNAMSGDERTRHCKACAKNVYNLSVLTRAEAERLILEKEGHLCVRLHRRADGTVITSDCPVGMAPLKKSARWARGVFAAAIAGVLTVFGGHARAADPPRVTMGAPQPAVQGEAAVITGKPSPLVMGRIMVRPVTSGAKAVTKAVKMPFKAQHGNRTPRKSAIRNSQSAINRRHR